MKKPYVRITRSPNSLIWYTPIKGLPTRLAKVMAALGVATNKVVLRRIASDLTHYQGPELQRRIDHALQLPD